MTLLIALMLLHHIGEWTPIHVIGIVSLWIIKKLC